MLVALSLASMKRTRALCAPNGSSGFSLIEVMVSMSVMMVLAAITIPMVSAASSNVKLHDQADNISNYVGLAKMRATARFSRARVYLDIAARTYVLQVFNQGAGAWANDTSVTTLPTGISFSFGDLDAPPTNTQPSQKPSPAPVDVSHDRLRSVSLLPEQRSPTRPAVQPVGVRHGPPMAEIGIGGYGDVAFASF